MRKQGYIDIQASTVPNSLASIFPQMGDVWEENGTPVEGIQGLALEEPLIAEELAALEAAKQNWEIEDFTYLIPSRS